MKVVLEHISKHYETMGAASRRDVLRDISLRIEPGDGLAIVGPSGSGKSTLLNIMGTLDFPSSGSIRHDEVDILTYNDKQLAQLRRDKIGFVFQLHHLLPQLSLLENILVPVVPFKDKARMKASRSKAMDLLDSVGLTDKIRQLPGQMSVGECQRGAVVRALINEPELILADEPTGSLDKESAGNMGELLSKIHADFGVAMVVVTHSENLAAQMSKVYRLENGELLINK